MIRKERTRILVHCSKEFLRQWAQYFEQQEPFHVIEEPKNALTMLRMRESAQHSLFYLGEVLVSETRVECRTVIGIGLIQGNELEKSYDLAVIDAACNAALPGWRSWRRLLHRRSSDRMLPMRGMWQAY